MDYIICVITMREFEDPSKSSHQEISERRAFKNYKPRTFHKKYPYLHSQSHLKLRIFLEKAYLV